MLTSFPLLVLLPIFVVGAAVTWLAGTQLSNMTDIISSRFGLGEALGGIIILVLATNLSNIVVVVSASLTHHIGIAIQSALPQAKNTDIYLASLGVLLTAVYIYGLIFRPKRQFLDLGIDSIVVLVLYIVATVGLFTIGGGK